MQLRAVWLLVGLAIVGCSETQQPQQSGVEQPSSPVVENKLEPASVTATAHKSPGKPSAGFALADKNPHRIEPGVPADLNLVLTAPDMNGSVRIELEATGGLEILVAPPTREFALGQREYSLPVRVLAPEAGRYYLRLRIDVEGERRRMHSVISAIVQAGPDVARDAETEREKTIKSAEEPGFISLPAEETVYPSPQ